MRQIADKITYIKLIFTKRKAAVRWSHGCLVFTRRAFVRCACIVASADARQSCKLHELSYGLWRSYGSRAIKRKFIARLSRSSLVAFAGKMRECELLR